MILFLVTVTVLLAVAGVIVIVVKSRLKRFSREVLVLTVLQKD